MLVMEGQPHRAATNLRRKLVRRFVRHGSTFSGVGASDQPGAVQTDERIKLLPEPAKQLVVIKFSGTASDALIASKTAELKEYAAAARLPIADAPILAFYNPPWTLPMFRRNEIMLEINTAR